MWFTLVRILKTYNQHAFNETGRALARTLKGYLGPESYVEFVTESDTGIDIAEVIE